MERYVKQTKIEISVYNAGKVVMWFPGDVDKWVGFNVYMDLVWGHIPSIVPLRISGEGDLVQSLWNDVTEELLVLYPGKTGYEIEQEQLAIRQAAGIRKFLEWGVQ